MISPNFLSAYHKLVQTIADTGQLASPRDQPVTECKWPVSWTIENPQEWVLAIPRRRLNPFFALAEVVWMWSGKGGADFITYYNTNMKSFLDPGIPYFNAAYGKRVRHAGYCEQPFRDTPYPRTTGQLPEPCEVDQLEFVRSKLEADPYTRQAVVCLWDVIKDNFHQSKDYPCNNLVYFSQRAGRLNVTVVIRSNDLIWGTPYNMIQFSHLQALMAGTLGWEVGNFTVMCNNLHYYTHLYPDVLANVLGWCNNVVAREIDLSYLNGLLPTWDMRWNLPAFDRFVRVWEKFEADLRTAHIRWTVQDGVDGSKEHRAHGAAINRLLLNLRQQFLEHRVPGYWQDVFKIMFMFHCRKAKVDDIYQDLLHELPASLVWLINDFTNK